MVVPEWVTLAPGDSVRVRLSWTDDGQIKVELDVVQWNSLMGPETR